jgi:hypothetical protein
MKYTTLTLSLLAVSGAAILLGAPQKAAKKVELPHLHPGSV